MRSKASTLLSGLALAQILILGFSLGFLVLKLRSVRVQVARLGQDERNFLRDLSTAEGDLYRTSLLLRDEILLEGRDRARVQQELRELLDRVADQKLIGPAWLSPEIRDEVAVVEKARREYFAWVRTIATWQEAERRRRGPQFLSKQMAPLRHEFTTTIRRISDVLRSLRESRNQEVADSMSDIQQVVVRLLLGSAFVGLLLVGSAVWRLQRYERERDFNIQSLQRAEEELRALSKSLVESQELERKKISRELHDEVGQTLTALRVQLGQIAAVSGDGHLQQASDLAERSLRSIREMARGLRPAMLDDLGLAPALQWLGRDFSRNTVLDVDVQVEGEMSALDEPSRTCLYRVVQEALTNCVKHSGAGSVRVLLHEGPSDVVLTIQDHGRGFESGRSRGVGLLGMRERVEELGGEFTVVSSVGSGVLIRANLRKGIHAKTDSNHHRG